MRRRARVHPVDSLHSLLRFLTDKDLEPEKSDNDMSRSSSVSNKDKTGKRIRKRREDSESFDARSQYKAYYPTPQQPAWTASPQLVNNMNMAGSRNAATMPNTYQHVPYPPMPQQYPAPMMGGGAMQFNQMGPVSTCFSVKYFAV